MSVCSLTSCRNALVTCQHGVSSLLSAAGAMPVKTWIVSSRCGPGQDSSHGSFPKLGPQLGSYEGGSFICSSLRLRREATAKSGIHIRNFSQDVKSWGTRWWRKMDGGETDRRAVVTLSCLLSWPASTFPSNSDLEDSAHPHP